MFRALTQNATHTWSHLSQARCCCCCLQIRNIQRKSYASHLEFRHETETDMDGPSRLTSDKSPTNQQQTTSTQHGPVWRPRPQAKPSFHELRRKVLVYAVQCLQVLELGTLLTAASSAAASSSRMSRPLPLLLHLRCGLLSVAEATAFFRLPNVCGALAAMIALPLRKAALPSLPLTLLLCWMLLAAAMLRFF